MEITPQQLEELRLGALTAIDGLWFLGVEKKFGYEAALELDLEVWRGYGLVMLKRLSRMLELPVDPTSPLELETVRFLLETVCRIDGTLCEGEAGDRDIVFRVLRCPWWDNLGRSGRESHVPCEFIDDTIFRHWLEALDHSLRLEVTRSMPRGDGCCEWVIRRD